MACELFWNIVNEIVVTGDADEWKNSLRRKIKNLPDGKFAAFAAYFYFVYDKVGGTLLNEAVEIAYGGPELGSDGTRDHCQSIVALGKEAWLTAVTDPGAFYVQFRNKMPKYPLIVDESCFGAPLYDEAVARFGEDFLEKWIVMMGQRDVFSNNYPAQLVEFYYPRIYQRSNQKDKKSIEHITVAKSGRQQQSSDLFFWRIIESTVNVPAEKKRPQSVNY